jgi:hypothetical protein
MARQQLLTSADAPQVWLVLNEAVVRRRVGGTEAMRAQLGRLLEAMDLGTVTLQIIPFEVGAHPSMDGSFSILGFPEQPLQGVLSNRVLEASTIPITPGQRALFTLTRPEIPLFDRWIEAKSAPLSAVNFANQ